MQVLTCGSVKTRSNCGQKMSAVFCMDMESKQNYTLWREGDEISPLHFVPVEMTGVREYGVPIAFPNVYGRGDSGCAKCRIIR